MTNTSKTMKSYVSISPDFYPLFQLTPVWYILPIIKSRKLDNSAQNWFQFYSHDIYNIFDVVSHLYKRHPKPDDSALILPVKYTLEIQQELELTRIDQGTGDW